MKSAFWEAFYQQDFEKLQTLFEKMDAAEKQAMWKELFQKAFYQRTPQVVSVLFRELHEGKDFEDFHESWFPEAQDRNPIEAYGQKFQQFFPVPTRVINAVNMDNPKEIVSVGLQWVTEEQVPELLEFVEGQSNKSRGDSIKEVAEKTKTGVYLVKTDDNLGIPF